ncbi:MIF4G domain-containing protein-like isoform X1 [Ptychodera flava]|uniref:MIF4G domain-containing protein-like isoform X1 n=1 Tax=Ptychodera flava TaxID=63121 RepID=UPI00396A3394
MQKEARPSPGLNMQHGFVGHIVRHIKGRKAPEEAETKKESKKHKASMQYYVPPAARAAATAGTQEKSKPAEKKEDSVTPMEWTRYGYANSMLVQQEINTYKLDKFSEEIQPYILQALLDSDVLTEEGLSLVMEDIVKLCMEDCQYCQTGTKLCDVIIQKEAGSGQKRALEYLVKVCEKYYQNKCALRNKSLSKWIAFVSLVCQLFLELKAASQLEDVVLNCLFTLVGPECLENEDEVDCLVTQLHAVGRPLQATSANKMEELYIDIRNAFLAWTTPALARMLLLQAIELYAGDWTLQDNARDFYYGGIDL